MTIEGSGGSEIARLFVQIVDLPPGEQIDLVEQCLLDIAAHHPERLEKIGEILAQASSAPETSVQTAEMTEDEINAAFAKLKSKGSLGKPGRVPAPFKKIRIGLWLRANEWIPLEEFAILFVKKNDAKKNNPRKLASNAIAAINTAFRKKNIPVEIHGRQDENNVRCYRVRKLISSS